MKFTLLILALNPFAMTIQCDVDHRVETILGVNLAPNFPPCGHVICDRHVRFVHGHAVCPLDGAQR